MDSQVDFQKFVRDALDIAGYNFCTVRFIKENGKLRKINFRPKDKRGVKGCNVRYDRNQIRILENRNAETGKEEWKSFLVSRLVSLSANSQRFHFNHVTNTIHEVT